MKLCIVHGRIKYIINNENDSQFEERILRDGNARIIFRLTIKKNNKLHFLFFFHFSKIDILMILIEYFIDLREFNFQSNICFTGLHDCATKSNEQYKQQV